MIIMVMMVMIMIMDDNNLNDDDLEYYIMDLNSMKFSAGQEDTLGTLLTDPPILQRP